MAPYIALFICIAGIAGLFFLDRETSVRNSKALWLPVIWLWIVGSRPVSSWFGIAPPAGVDVQFQGSAVDRFVFLILVSAGIVVLVLRRRQTSAFLKANWPILIYFTFSLLSVLWSDFPLVAFKRWIKAIGDLVMVLIVVTDAQPVTALKRFLARTGFVLLPLSIVLIVFFPHLGRAPFSRGRLMNTGVTLHKNSLGVLTLVLLLGALWRVLALLPEMKLHHRARRLLAQGTLLALGVVVLVMAHSTTSAVCFALGAILILAAHLPEVKRRPGTVHALLLMIVLAGGLTLLLGGGPAIVQALGKTTKLTRRTEIWAGVIQVVPNRFVGAGFESFWLGPRVAKVFQNISPMHPNEAHNGYIEVYLNLGWVGVGLIMMILIDGYKRAMAAFRRDPGTGSLMLAYVVAAAAYSITEAGFRSLNPMWIFLLLAVVAAGVIGVDRREKAPNSAGAGLQEGS